MRPSRLWHWFLGHLRCMAAEQFGTNIRATVATTVPNVVRGALTLVSLLFVKGHDLPRLCNQRFGNRHYCDGNCCYIRHLYQKKHSEDLDYIEK